MITISFLLSFFVYGGWERGGSGEVEGDGESGGEVEGESGG